MARRVEHIPTSNGFFGSSAEVSLLLGPGGLAFYTELKPDQPDRSDAFSTSMESWWRRASSILKDSLLQMSPWLGVDPGTSSTMITSLDTATPLP